MKLVIVFCVRVRPVSSPPLYLRDTCAGGVYGEGEREAVTWDTREELVDALEEAEIEQYDDQTPLEVVELIQRGR